MKTYECLWPDGTLRTVNRDWLQTAILIVEDMPNSNVPDIVRRMREEFGIHDAIKHFTAAQLCIKRGIYPEGS